MKHTLINCALFAALLATMLSIQVIDDMGPENAVASEELVKQRQQDRFEKAALEICGPNAGYAVTKGNVLVCKTHRGRATGKTASL